MLRCTPVRRRGFTLIEMLVAIIVAGILLAIALPAFRDAMRKSRRAEAMAALSQAQLAQERWRANNNAYASDLASINIPATTSSGYYALSVSGASAGGYTLAAAVRSGTPQADDAACATMRVTMANGTISYSSVNAGGSVDSGSPNRCWVR